MTLSAEDAIAKDHNHRAWKAWKTTSTPGMMLNLVDDLPDDETVLLGVAWNHVTPRKLLEFLAQSNIERVKRAAAWRLAEDAGVYDPLLTVNSVPERPKSEELQKLLLGEP